MVTSDLEVAGSQCAVQITQDCDAGTREIVEAVNPSAITIDCGDRGIPPFMSSAHGIGAQQELLLGGKSSDSNTISKDRFTSSSPCACTPASPLACDTSSSSADTSTPSTPTTAKKQSWCADVNLKTLLFHFGPAFVVSVAYIDPGNFATNISAGSQFGYSLVWVLLWSNIIAMFVQCMSAKLGIATSKNLPELCAARFSRGVNWFLWVVAVIAVMATDLAEFLGGVYGFYFLFNIPVYAGAALTAVISLAVAYLNGKAQRLLELLVGLFVAVITLSYVVELFLAKPSWWLTLQHMAVPAVPSPRGDAVRLSVGMLGATVMPHVVYLHSELVQHRQGKEIEHTLAQRSRHYFLEKIDVFVAMSVAGVVNAAMLVVSAAVFGANSLSVVSIEDAHKSLSPLLGALSGAAFGVALLMSGLSSSTVGTISGEVIINGFVGLKVPLWLRRLITMTPGLAILISGADPMSALVYSQVSLSFALPAALIPLIILVTSRDVMGSMVVGRVTACLGWVVVSVIVVLNCLLLVFLGLDLFG